MKEIIEKIKKDVPSFGSIPFWSWNDRLDPEELKRQMRDMKSIGMGGAFMHARAGLETEYLSDEWFNCINECIKEAESLGMQAWCYDENGWPSGFGGGLLLKDRNNLAISVEYKYGAFSDADDLTIAVYKKNADGSFTRVTEDSGEKEYLILYRKYDVAYVDTLNAEVTKKFIECTHEEYKRRIPADKFGTGKPMPGFFTDEPQYCRWGNPYSEILPEEFRNAYGYEVYDVLPSIFFDYPGCDKHRYDYYYLLHRLFTNNFIKVIYDWCVENGVELTGHAVEEVSLSTQMWCCGGVMPFYEYETIPGIDYLGRDVKNDISYKQLGSACAQLGKKKALSEMFACCGWDVSPTELKKIADAQYAGGINLMCQHLYPYSERGQRKRDYPLHYSEHNPWHDDFGDFNRYYSNLGAILTQGEEYAPLLVIHPMHSAYCRFKMNEWNMVDLESKFLDLVNTLGENQIPYHFGDEWMMQRMAHIEGDRWVIGKCEYKAVLVPYLYTLDDNTVKLLEEYTRNGGKVYLYDGKPIYVDGSPAGSRYDFLESNMTLDDILALRDTVLSCEGKPTADIRRMSRTVNGSRLVFLTNVGKTDYSLTEVTLPRGKWAELDVATLELKPVFTGNGHAVLRFNEGESHLLVTVTEEEYSSIGSADRPSATEEYIPVPESVTLTGKIDNVITLDYASRSDDGVNYEQPMFLMGIKDNLLRERYDGKVWLKFTYDVEKGYRPNSLRLAVEPMYERISVNGTDVEPGTDWWFDRSFATVDIASLTHEGRNEIIIEVNHHQSDHVYYVLYSGVAEALRNCLHLDTEIENIYLVGDFALRTDKPFTDSNKPNVSLYDGSFVLCDQPGSVQSNDVISCGFPFYGGKISTEFEYTYKKGMPTVLLLDGRHASADIRVNNVPAGKLLCGRDIDLSHLLTEGSNTIGVTICTSLRNVMGPHHRGDAELYSLGPESFSYENQWNGRECKDFFDRYSFVRFGLVK